MSNRISQFRTRNLTIRKRKRLREINKYRNKKLKMRGSKKQIKKRRASRKVGINKIAKLIRMIRM